MARVKQTQKAAVFSAEGYGLPSVSHITPSSGVADASRLTHPLWREQNKVNPLTVSPIMSHDHVGSSMTCSLPFKDSPGSTIDSEH